MDRISHLPDFIIHHILSYVSKFDGLPVHLVRMSVLSKTWFNLTASYPILNFDNVYFTSRKSFFKYVEYTTSRFCHQKKNVTAAQVFKLFTTVEEPTEIYIVDKCLELVLRNGVREMEIYISRPSSIPKYRLPNILLTVSVLKSLTISYCELPCSIMVDAIKFKSLIQLTLENARIDDEGIKHLTACCPLLQELKILSCYGFKRLCVYGHQSLQKFSIDYHIPFEMIDIEAPNLSYIWVDDIYDRGPPRMNLASCKNLTTVTYFGHLLPNDFLSNLPFIENLRFIFHKKCNNLKWSSHSLRTLVLESDCDLNEIELNTPNLVLFVYGSSWAMTDEYCSSIRVSTQLKPCMRCYPDCRIDALWLQKLRLFFEKKNGFKALNLYIHTSPEFIELEELNEIKLPPYELEHVELELDIDEESSDHAAFVAAVLWFFSPQSLTLRSSFPLSDSGEHSNDVIKLICEKLSQQGDQGHTNIEIASCHEGKTISFRNKEVVQEESG